MSGSELAVVVASVNGLPYLAECLQSLEEHCAGAEVIVADATTEETRRVIRERWPSVRLISFDEPQTVPELRAAGVFASSAPHVALIEDHCVVRPGWPEAILVAHRDGHPVVGGAVHNAADRRLRDWAAFLCEYSEFLDPVPPGRAHALPGMNVSYNRAAIAAIAGLLREGRWETWLHAHLERSGFVLHSSDGMTIDHVKDFGFGEFVAQRYHYARSYAGMRNPELRWKRLVYMLGSPLLVPLLYSRIARNVLGRRRHRRTLLGATPLLLVYLGVWSLGETVGYAFGGGRSLLRVR
jgi:Glycosyl transferase family 2